MRGDLGGKMRYVASQILWYARTVWWEHKKGKERKSSGYSVSTITLSRKGKIYLTIQAVYVLLFWYFCAHLSPELAPLATSAFPGVGIR